MNSVNKSIVLGIITGVMLIIIMVLGIVLINQHYKELQQQQEQPTAETVEVDNVEVQEQGAMITLNINGELHDYYYEFAE